MWFDFAANEVNLLTFSTKRKNKALIYFSYDCLKATSQRSIKAFLGFHSLLILVYALLKCSKWMVRE